MRGGILCTYGNYSYESIEVTQAYCIVNSQDHLRDDIWIYDLEYGNDLKDLLKYGPDIESIKDLPEDIKLWLISEKDKL